MPIYTNNPCDDGFFPIEPSLRSSIGIGPKVTKAIDSATKDWLDNHPEATTTVKDDSITNVKLKDGSVNSRTIEDESITTDDIADLAVTTPKIADNAVTAAKIASAAADGLRIMNTTQPGVAKVGAGLAMNNGALELNGNGDIAAAVTAWLDAHPEATTTVQDGAVTTAKLADGAVTDTKLAQTNGVLSRVAKIENSYFNKTAAATPTVKWENSCLVNNGYTGTNSGFVTSNPVEIPKGTKYLSPSFSFEPPIANRVGIVFFKARDLGPDYATGVVSGAFKAGDIFDVPENTVFARFSCDSTTQTLGFEFVAESLEEIGDALSLEHATGTNLINKAEVVRGYLINGNSTSQGVLQESASSYATGYVPMQEGVDYYLNGWLGYYAFYDEHKQYISGADNTAGDRLTYPFRVPANTKYGRFSIIPAQVSVDDTWLNTKDEKPDDYGLLANVYSKGVYVDNPCEYEGMDICSFSSCVCIGDSLTYGGYNATVQLPAAFIAEASEKHSYPTKLGKMTGMDVTNKGDSGASTAQWWTHHQNDDLSGYEMAIIQLGVNDKVAGDTEWPAAAKTAMQNIIEKLQEENTNIKIFVATVIPAMSYGNRDYISEGIRNLVAEIADPNVILVDIAVHGHTADRPDYNCGHLSAYGYWRLARDYVNYISYIMANDQNDVFREIQFIGTDYVSGYSS